jgi:hypothetical protein
MASRCAWRGSWSDSSLSRTVARLAARGASIEERGHRVCLREPTLCPKRTLVRTTRASFRVGGASLERRGGPASRRDAPLWLDRASFTQRRASATQRDATPWLDRASFAQRDGSPRPGRVSPTQRDASPWLVRPSFDLARSRSSSIHVLLTQAGARERQGWASPGCGDAPFQPARAFLHFGGASLEQEDAPEGELGHLLEQSDPALEETSAAIDAKGGALARTVPPEGFLDEAQGGEYTSLPTRTWRNWQTHQIQVLAG